MVEPERIRRLNNADAEPDGHYVLYWMQQSQRANGNHALEYAIELANARRQPVVVAFGLTDDYPEANARHYLFMLQGLAEVAAALMKRSIKFVVRRGEPAEIALEMAEEASVIVCDCGYLRHQRDWREAVAREAGKKVVTVESDVVVPAHVVSNRLEFAARTIRPKIQRNLGEYLQPVKHLRPRNASLRLRLGSAFPVGNPQKALSQLAVNRDVEPVTGLQGGYGEARKTLRRFIRSHLRGYADARNDPADPTNSLLSPYLHFGQIAPVEVACTVSGSKSGSEADKAAFLEQLIVRRELAVNFVNFEPNYDQYRCLPSWARETLEKHAADPRPYVYSLRELETASTHDPYWNAAQTEMVKTGFMHNYMRMYWGKKIIEWSNSPRAAYKTALSLNNKYFLDGRDPNSYASVAWLFGLHDRPWAEREIFGKVRYMNANGLKRKFDIERYVNRMQAL